MSKWKRLPKMNVCSYCGIAFHPYHYHAIFCSRKCAVRGRPGKLKRNQFRVLCNNCGKIFRVNKYRKEHGNKFYCSRGCYWIDKKKTSTGERNPNWKGGIEHKRNISVRINNMSMGTGMYFERKSKKILENNGFNVMKSGGSKGIFDLIASNTTTVKFIQVKAGKSYPSKQEKERLSSAKVPFGCTKELWRWIKFDSEPSIEIIP